MEDEPEIRTAPVPNWVDEIQYAMEEQPRLSGRFADEEPEEDEHDN